MVRTPAQVHSLSTACQAHGKNTSSSAPASHCIPDRHMVRTPFKRTRVALYPCQAHGKNTRSSAPAQHCVHARHMVRTPAQRAPAQHCAHARHMVRTPSQAHPGFVKDLLEGQVKMKTRKGKKGSICMCKAFCSDQR